MPGHCRSLQRAGVLRGEYQLAQFPLAGVAYQSSLAGNYDIAIGAMDMTQSGSGSLLYATYSAVPTTTWRANCRSTPAATCF